MKPTKFQLKNKLTVLLLESKKSPVVSVQMWVKTGSADEKKSEEGISHFIEHLVFKGTQKYKVGEIASAVEAAGGELNAYTSFDQTVFYVTISKNFKEVALDVISQMMGFPAFDPGEIESEREVVCEEIKMGQDSPGRRASQQLFASVYKKHAYGVPVIGYEKNVRRWSAKKIKDFYHSRYVPTNMFLVVSGDFETIEMKTQVNKYFSAFKSFKLRSVKRTKEPVQKRFQQKTEKYNIQDRHLHMAFKAPNIKHRDVPAMDVLATILGQGDSALLVKKLRLEKSIVSSISAFNYNPKDEGLFAISARYQGEQFNEIVREVCAQINILQSSPASWSDVKRARVALSAEQFYSIETVDGLANKAGTLEFYFKDQGAQKKYLAALNQITPKEVQRVAKKYLKFNKLSASFLGDVEAAVSAKQLANIKNIWQQSFLRKPVKSDSIQNKKVAIPKLVLKSGGRPGVKHGDRRGEKAGVEKIVLPSGIKILFKPAKDTPTVSAKFVFRGGARLEQSETMGLSELTSRVWISGTKNKSEAQLMQALEESAIGLSAFSGKNTFGFSLEYLAAFEETALSLSVDSILNSSFDAAVIEREKHVLTQAVKSREDHPSSLCAQQFFKSLFGNHPLAYEAIGTNESLPYLNRDKIIELKNKLFLNNNLVVVVIGDYNKKLWLQSLAALEKGFASVLKDSSAAANGPKGFVQPLHKIQELTRPQRIFLEKDKEQSHIIIGWRGLTLTDPERYTLYAIEAILAGQGGRLFFELRDKSSLAYSVSPMRMESLETGYFGGYIACSHEKVEKSIEMFQVEFAKLTKELVGEVELDRAKKYLIGQHDIGLQRKSALCNLIAFDEIYGNDFNQSLNVAEEYNKVTPQKILALAKKLFIAPSVISVVGRKV